MGVDRGLRSGRGGAAGDSGIRGDVYGDDLEHLKQLPILIQCECTDVQKKK